MSSSVEERWRHAVRLEQMRHGGAFDYPWTLEDSNPLQTMFKRLNTDLPLQPFLRDDPSPNRKYGGQTLTVSPGHKSCVTHPVNLPSLSIPSLTASNPPARATRAREPMANGLDPHSFHPPSSRLSNHAQPRASPNLRVIKDEPLTLSSLGISPHRTAEPTVSFPSAPKHLDYQQPNVSMDAMELGQRRIQELVEQLAHRDEEIAHLRRQLALADNTIHVQSQQLSRLRTTYFDAQTYRDVHLEFSPPAIESSPESVNRKADAQVGSTRDTLDPPSLGELLERRESEAFDPETWLRSTPLASQTRRSRDLTHDTTAAAAAAAALSGPAQTHAADSMVDFSLTTVQAIRPITGPSFTPQIVVNQPSSSAVTLGTEVPSIAPVTVAATEGEGKETEEQLSEEQLSEELLQLAGASGGQLASFAAVLMSGDMNEHEASQVLAALEKESAETRDLAALILQLNRKRTSYSQALLSREGSRHSSIDFGSLRTPSGGSGFAKHLDQALFASDNDYHSSVPPTPQRPGLPHRQTRDSMTLLPYVTASSLISDKTDTFTAEEASRRVSRIPSRRNSDLGSTSGGTPRKSSPSVKRVFREDYAEEFNQWRRKQSGPSTPASSVKFGYEHT
eukprot:GILK01005125.1.p1 GENE.GILK01005125.1~~GILK01005125.1.p1  ORF type:complete len:621 (+),score=101.41 GILK01005125.1:81-1943(+)